MDISIPTTVTIPELARISGKNPTFLAKIAARLGYSKSGRDYVLTRAEAKQLLKSIKPRNGNPEFGKMLGNGKRAAATT